jgi:hypothetical protein
METLEVITAIAASAAVTAWTVGRLAWKVIQATARAERHAVEADREYQRAEEARASAEHWQRNIAQAKEARDEARAAAERYAKISEEQREEIARLKARRSPSCTVEDRPPFNFAANFRDAVREAAEELAQEIGDIDPDGAAAIRAALNSDHEAAEAYLRKQEEQSREQDGPARVRAWAKGQQEAADRLRRDQRHNYATERGQGEGGPVPVPQGPPESREVRTGSGGEARHPYEGNPSQRGEAGNAEAVQG